ncbi:ADP-ribose pyrophosphatase YjhB (NUDIX family) [Saonia flava]|uniref:ADP-ribose pyrophosphatase YjhB (NUDIX family) n=1 Tax=Saonia flava TaxID=523696 RepID=A0A846R2B9_9FLAO|nr:NUDIX domain-containing protein [Saonia flava]NJB72085.1 ADP-ribose pyrophosphatase YjhB (NUDIX family) [Saonia flava]
MKTEKEFHDFLENGDKYYIPNLTIDCAIFGYHGKELKILLAKWRGLDGWGLPGGFIKKKETLSNAATRILKEKTSLDKLYLKQFHVFGDSEFRRKEKEGLSFSPGNNRYLLPKNSWLHERTISIGYYALVEYSQVNLMTDYFIEELVWQDINQVPKLLFDHNEMLSYALRNMRINLYHIPIGYNLLPNKFTLPEIQSLYETILDKKLDRRNFSKKLLKLELIKDTKEVKKIGQHRSPKLYQFDMKKYNEALKNGIVLAI